MVQKCHVMPLSNCEFHEKSQCYENPNFTLCSTSDEGVSLMLWCNSTKFQTLCNIAHIQYWEVIPKGMFSLLGRFLIIATVTTSITRSSNIATSLQAGRSVLRLPTGA